MYICDMQTIKRLIICTFFASSCSPLKEGNEVNLHQLQLQSGWYLGESFKDEYAPFLIYADFSEDTGIGFDEHEWRYEAVIRKTDSTISVISRNGLDQHSFNGRLSDNQFVGAYKVNRDEKLYADSVRFRLLQVSDRATPQTYSNITYSEESGDLNGFSILTLNTETTPIVLFSMAEGGLPNRYRAAVTSYGAPDRMTLKIKTEFDSLVFVLHQRSDLAVLKLAGGEWPPDTLPLIQYR
jgi:hypothetical protein